MNHDATLLLVLETALDAVIVMRTDGSVAEWNEEAARVFGWRREEVLDRMLGNLIVPAQHRQAHVDGLTRYLASGEGPVQIFGIGESPVGLVASTTSTS